MKHDHDMIFLAKFFVVGIKNEICTNLYGNGSSCFFLENKVTVLVHIECGF